MRGSCSCKAGCRGWCKHAAAVAVYINSHENKSCTELPRAWGKPSARPTLDSKKEIKDLFASKYEERFLVLLNLFNFKMICTGRPLPPPVLKPLCPKTIHAQFPDLRCAFADIVACEGSHESANPTRASTDAVEESLDPGLEVVKSLLGEARETYATMEVASTVPLKINRCNLLAVLEEREKAFYETFVKKSVDEIAEIALLTRGQAAVDRFVISAAFI